jgi:uncharacterized protein (UPF0332 family)
MFHAARAVLFQAVGDAPKRHDRTIQQFGLLVRNLDDALRNAGRALNEAKDERTDADYDERIAPSPDEARDAMKAAIKLPGRLRGTLQLPAHAVVNSDPAALAVTQPRTPECLFQCNFPVW